MTCVTLLITVHDLTAREVGLKVLTGHGSAIDTTTAAGKLVYGIFAALAEFEREMIKERTLAGIASARARGRKGGRPKGMSQAAIEKAVIAEALYQNGSIPVKKIAEQLSISKTTLYLYLRHRNVCIGEKFQAAEVVAD